MELTKKIVFTEDGQVNIAHIGKSAKSYEDVVKTVVPNGVEYQLLDDTTENFPTSRIFRNAWIESQNSVSTDLEGARVIAHEYRRLSRDIEMQPLDVKVTIPGEVEVAEASRADLRLQYADIQTKIDEAKTVKELELLAESLKYFKN